MIARQYVVTDSKIVKVPAEDLKCLMRELIK